MKVSKPNRMIAQCPPAPPRRNEYFANSVKNPLEINFF